jgi:hypothetical protein
MNAPVSNSLLKEITLHLHPALPGMLFAVITLLFGFVLGIVFGVNEDIIKSRLKASATEVRESTYRGDDAAMKAVLDKSWVYMQRAHLHAGGLGATAVGLILLVSLLGTSRGMTRAISLGLGLGGLGYSVYWLLAGLRAPGLGNTGKPGHAYNSLRLRTIRNQERQCRPKLPGLRRLYRPVPTLVSPRLLT